MTGTSALPDHGLGEGIYTVREASRLTNVSPGRIRRWLLGYHWRYEGERRRSPPVLRGDFPEERRVLQLSFRDMLEVRVINALRDYGISWHEIRRAARASAEVFSTKHPFVCGRFRTDGRRIFAELTEGSGESHLIELARHQHVFRKVLAPTLRGLEFSGDELVRWWPLGQRKRVVVDPNRSLGRPIGVRSGVPTVVLDRFAEATDIKEAARWFEVDRVEVRHAVDFERHYAA